jgi:hypothetical protein
MARSKAQTLRSYNALTPSRSDSDAWLLSPI